MATKKKTENVSNEVNEESKETPKKTTRKRTTKKTSDAVAKAAKLAADALKQEPAENPEANPSIEDIIGETKEEETPIPEKVEIPDIPGAFILEQGDFNIPIDYMALVAILDGAKCTLTGHENPIEMDADEDPSAIKVKVPQDSTKTTERNEQDMVTAQFGITLGYMAQRIMDLGAALKASHDELAKLQEKASEQHEMLEKVLEKLDALSDSAEKDEMYSPIAQELGELEAGPQPMQIENMYGNVYNISGGWPTINDSCANVPNDEEDEHECSCCHDDEDDDISSYEEDDDLMDLIGQLQANDDDAPSNLEGLTDTIQYSAAKMVLKIIENMDQGDMAGFHTKGAFIAKYCPFLRVIFEPLVDNAEEEDGVEMINTILDMTNDIWEHQGNSILFEDATTRLEWDDESEDDEE